MWTLKWPNRSCNPVGRAALCCTIFPGCGEVWQEHRATTPQRDPVAPAFSALQGGVALQVASWKVSRYRGLSQLHYRSQGITQRTPKTPRKNALFGHIRVGARNRYHLSNWRFNLEMVHFLDPKKRLCWPTFDMYHVKRILMSKYYKIQHLGAFWPVSLTDFVFPQKAKVSEKDIHYFLVPNARK